MVCQSLYCGTYRVTDAWMRAFDRIRRTGVEASGHFRHDAVRSARELAGGAARPPSGRSIHVVASSQQLRPCCGSEPSATEGRGMSLAGPMACRFAPMNRQTRRPRLRLWVMSPRPSYCYVLPSNSNEMQGLVAWTTLSLWPGPWGNSKKWTAPPYIRWQSSIYRHS